MHGEAGPVPVYLSLGLNFQTTFAETVLLERFSAMNSKVLSWLQGLPQTPPISPTLFLILSVVCGPWLLNTVPWRPVLLFTISRSPCLCGLGPTPNRTESDARWIKTEEWARLGRAEEWPSRASTPWRTVATCKHTKGRSVFSRF